jgi:hypothetical protein
MMDAPDIFASLWAGLRPWAESLGVLAIGAAGGFVALFLARLMLRHGLERNNPVLGGSLRARSIGVLAWFLPVLGVYLALPASGPATEQPWLARCWSAY